MGWADLLCTGSAAIQCVSVWDFHTSCSGWIPRYHVSLDSENWSTSTYKNILLCAMPHRFYGKHPSVLWLLILDGGGGRINSRAQERHVGWKKNTSLNPPWNLFMTPSPPYPPTYTHITYTTHSHLSWQNLRNVFLAMGMQGSVHNIDAILPYCLSLNCGRTPENPEEHIQLRENVHSPHTHRGSGNRTSNTGAAGLHHAIRLFLIKC